MEHPLLVESPCFLEMYWTFSWWKYNAWPVLRAAFPSLSSLNILLLFLSLVPPQPTPRADTFTSCSCFQWCSNSMDQESHNPSRFLSLSLPHKQDITYSTASPKMSWHTLPHFTPGILTHQSLFPSLFILSHVFPSRAENKAQSQCLSLFHDRALILIRFTKDGLCPPVPTPQDLECEHCT